MADKITWLLGADTSQVRAEMSKTIQGVKDMGRGVSDALDKTDRRQKSLLESNNKVTNQFQGFSRTLMNASSAADVASASLDRLENSLNLSLGGGIALAGGAVIIDQLSKFQKAYLELNTERAKLSKARPDAAFQSMAGIQSHLEKLISLRERLEKVQKAPYSRLGQDIAGGGGSPFGFILGAVAEDAGRKKQIADLSKMEDQAIRDMVGKRREQSDIKASNAPGFEKEAMEAGIKFRELGSSVATQTQAFIELTQTIREITKKYNDMKAERAGMSLKELADTPSASSGFNSDGTTWSISYERWKAGEDARKAMALEAQGEAARLNFDPVGANTAFNAAGEMKDSITNLKPSEKMSSDFKGALSVTEERLQEIATNTAQPIVNK